MQIKPSPCQYHRWECVKRFVHHTVPSPLKFVLFIFISNGLGFFFENPTPYVNTSGITKLYLFLINEAYWNRNTSVTLTNLNAISFCALHLQVWCVMLQIYTHNINYYKYSTDIINVFWSYAIWYQARSPWDPLLIRAVVVFLCEMVNPYLLFFGFGCYAWNSDLVFLE